MKPIPAPPIPGKTDWERFDNAMRKVLKPQVSPYLAMGDVNRSVKRCSVCKKEFPPDTQPSVGRAFRDHVLAEHRS